MAGRHHCLSVLLEAGQGSRARELKRLRTKRAVLWAARKLYVSPIYVSCERSRGQRSFGFFSDKPHASFLFSFGNLKSFSDASGINDKFHVKRCLFITALITVCNEEGAKTAAFHPERETVHIFELKEEA